MSRRSRSVLCPLLSFELSHSHPLLPLGLVSNVSEYSWLIVGRCVECYFSFWFTLYWSSFNLQGHFGHAELVGYGKRCSKSSEGCRSAIYPTINQCSVSRRKRVGFGGRGHARICSPPFFFNVCHVVAFSCIIFCRWMLCV